MTRVRDDALSPSGAVSYRASRVRVAPGGPAGWRRHRARVRSLHLVEADSEALGQALLNLVNNAIKYSREVKSLALAVRQAGDKVLVSVADRGIGVPKGEHKKIFEKFYRGEASLVHETKGSGLGLSLVEHIMDAHGGTVEIESAPGKGSTFTLVLPVARKKKG